MHMTSHLGDVRGKVAALVLDVINGAALVTQPAAELQVATPRSLVQRGVALSLHGVKVELEVSEPGRQR